MLIIIVMAKNSVSLENSICKLLAPYRNDMGLFFSSNKIEPPQGNSILSGRSTPD